MLRQLGQRQVLQTAEGAEWYEIVVLAGCWAAVAGVKWQLQDCKDGQSSVKNANLRTLNCVAW